MNMSPKLVIALDDATVDITELSSLVGGKGKNLILLSRTAATSSNNTILVPPGFVVTTHAYQALLEANDKGLQEEIDAELQQLDAAADDNLLLEQVSQLIQLAFSKRSLPSYITEKIQQQIARLFVSGTTFVAVRSSATCEDLGEASFAGQHDTYLQIAVCDIAAKIMDCFASLFTARALSYRRNHHVQHPQMAVVVQQMVNSQASGVLFTANPLTGNRYQFVIEAVSGLGEALVSGLTEPDRYLVQRKKKHTKLTNRIVEETTLFELNNNDDYFILETKIGAKKKAIVPKEGGGGVQVVEHTEKHCKAVLQDTIVLELARLGAAIEDLYKGEPQDVEWAVYQNIVHVVQSRPITTLFPVPPKHNHCEDDLEVMFSFGAIQGFSAPFYPAGQDSIQLLLGGFIRFATWGRNQGTTVVNVIGERLFPNVTRIIRNQVGRKVICKFLSFVEPGILAGLEKTLEENGEDRLAYDSGMSPFMLIRLLTFQLFNILPGAFSALVFPERSRDKAISRLNQCVASVQKRADAMPSTTTTLSDVLQFKRETLGDFFPAVVPKFACNVPVLVGSMVALMNMTTKQLGSTGKNRVYLLTRGIPNNPTTEMDMELWRTAQTIQANETSKQEFQFKSAEDLASNYLAGRLSPWAQQAVQGFMNQYGMRGLYEIDLGRPRWREDPEPLMLTLKTYVGMEVKSHAPDELFRRGEHTAQEEILKLGLDLGRPRTVTFLSRRIRALSALREVPKFTIIRIMGIIRTKLIEQGEKFVSIGVLEESRDIFLLHDRELDDLSANPIGRDWKTLIGERKAIMERETSRKRVPRVLTTDGFGYYGGAPIPPGLAEKANVFIGEPVSPGTVEGIVRVVHDPSKTKLEHGEVLVCHGTDPSWTPLFLSSCALVMEVGGLVTHGSIVAREVGIPAVVGLENVTDHLKTGQRIRVNGSNGVVEILEERIISPRPPTSCK
jgi:phosphohistidine swiveling domain-containing protein